MKRQLLVIGCILVALTVVLSAIAQTQSGQRPQGTRGAGQNLTEEQQAQMRTRFENMSEEERAQMRQRFAGRTRMSREDQLKSIAELEAQVAKLKASIDAQPQTRGNFQDMSEEERTKAREQSTKAREERLAVVAAIRAEVDKLSPPRATAEQIEALRELRAIKELADKEKAVETAKRLEAAIQKQSEQMPMFGGFGGGGQRTRGGQRARISSIIL